MKVVAIAVFLQLYVDGTVSGKGADETVVGALNESVVLPCHSHGNVTPSFTRWTKGEQEIISRNYSSTSPDPSHGLKILGDGSLEFEELILSDEGTYVCSCLSKGNATRRSVQLQIASGPEYGATSVSPAIALPNGTLLVQLGSTVYINCTSSSYPSQKMAWSFHGACSSNDTLVSGSGTWLNLKIDNIQLSAQGEYNCKAENTLSHRKANWSTHLLVYYVPERHPECTWSVDEDPSHVQFNCSWFGAHPVPTLYWGENHKEPRNHLDGHLYSSKEANTLTVLLNRSLLFHGQELKCTAVQALLPQQEEKSCTFKLMPPFPKGELLVTAVEGSNMSLICTEDSSLPPAITAWKRTAGQVDIVPGSKYHIMQDGPIFRLTIINVSKEDEGLYFCRSENPLGIQELEVYLTVKSSSAYTGAIIGFFLAILIVGSGIIVAKVIYSSRDRICLGSGFGRMEEHRGDVISLVESDEEEIFQGTVPRLPPVTNGLHTTLVQIHRIPSSDHEDTEVDTSPQQQEDTVEKEEPQDLLSF